MHLSTTKERLGNMNPLKKWRTHNLGNDGVLMREPISKKRHAKQGMSSIYIILLMCMFTT